MVHLFTLVDSPYWRQQGQPPIGEAVKLWYEWMEDLQVTLASAVDRRSRDLGRPGVPAARAGGLQDAALLLGQVDGSRLARSVASVGPLQA